MKQGKIGEVRGKFSSIFVQISISCTKYKKYCAYLDNMHNVPENIADD